MKKAKRLLAILLAALMLFTAASVPSYGYTAGDNWHNPGTNNMQKYYFEYGQAASWLLDMLDDMLADLSICMTCGELDAMLTDVISLTGTIKLDEKLEDADSVNEDGDPCIDIRSVDSLIRTLYGVVRCLKSDTVKNLGNVVGVFIGGGTKGLGDLRTDDKGLVLTGLDSSKTRNNGVTSDKEVLEMLILWISNQKNFLQNVITKDNYEWGLLNGSTINLGEILSDALAPISVDMNNLPKLIKDLLYTMLIDSTASGAPEGETLDQWVQKIIDWALITGTGLDAASGAESLLGSQAEPLMPAIGDQPGGASIGGEAIVTDRNKDGVEENNTMSFYQLVNNVIQALMNGTVRDMLYDLLADMLEIEITEEFPMGDPDLLNDSTYSLVKGIIIGLLEDNGAPELKLTGNALTYPVPQINALLDWLLTGGGLDALVLIDFYGFHIQDGFMSLLNDVARLLINLLPSLGLFEDSAHLAYEPEDLNRIWYIDDNFNYVEAGAETASLQTYVTFETGEVIYPTEFMTDEAGAQVPTAYCYLETKAPVSLGEGDGQVNETFIRPNYVISTKMVFANIIKLALNDFIDGCYFPEWTTDIPSVLAYGVAALAAPVVPENDYYERLDAYHEDKVNGTSTADALPYTTVKTIAIKDINGNQVGTRNVEVPTAALNILCSWGAKQLNGFLRFQNDAHKLCTDTTLERFGIEMLNWGMTYMPAFLGTYDSAQKKYIPLTVATGNETYTADGIFMNTMNTVISAVYSDYPQRTVKADANWDIAYEFIDGTLLQFIPRSWLPNINGSAQLFNEWLFGNLIDFNLQGILDVLSVNTDASAELHKPVKKVLINIVDRVLALVFNDHAVLISSGTPTGRTGVIINDNITSMSTLDELIQANSTSDSLPMLIWNLLDLLNKYKTPLLTTLLPLLVGDAYQRPYDPEYLTNEGLGRNMTTYGVADLEEYYKDLYDNVNTTDIREFVVDSQNPDAARADAEAAVDGKAMVVKNDDGVRMDVILSNGLIYGTYASREEANAVVDTLKNSYYYEVTNVEGEVLKYVICSYDSYLGTADGTLKTDDAGEYTEYTNFRFSQLTFRADSADGIARYNRDVYECFEIEDWLGAEYSYFNSNDADETARDYADEYRSYVNNDLTNAYGEWVMFDIKQQLRKADLYDDNGDGYSVKSTSDSDYVAAADGVTEVPVDGDPDIPEAMYPYYTTNANSFNYYDIDAGTSVSERTKQGFWDANSGEAITDLKTNDFNTTNFEQIRMAVELGNNPAKNIVLSDSDAEAVVRLAVGSIAFDITLNANGEYNGQYQWDNMPADYVTKINTWCTTNGFTYETETLEDGTVKHMIKRPAFKLLNDGITYGETGINSTPDLNAKTILDYKRGDLLDNTTYAQQIEIAKHDGYIEYITTLYQNRRSLYNQIDEMGYRLEQAEEFRAKKADTTMLEWVLNLTENDYKSSQTRKRNFIYKTDENGNVIFDEAGNPVEARNFTTTSYEKFRNAWDYGNSLKEAVEDADIQAAGISQSLVSAAYAGILDAWQNLVKFEGFADWVQIDGYVAVAQSILTDPYVNDPEFGVASGLDKLEQALKDALLYTDFAGSTYDTAPESKARYDSESQAEIDSVAALLNQAIQNLVYNQIPSVKQDPGLEDAVVNIQSTKYEDQIQYAVIYGLKEGVGFGDGTLTAEETLEYLGLKISGMTVDGTATTVSRTQGEKGSGTGTTIDGRYRSMLRFRYSAVLYGDLNGDTRIDGTDATKLAIILAKNELATVQTNEPAVYEAADANHDGAVDIEDIQTIRDHYAHQDLGSIKIDQSTHSPVSDAQAAA